MHSDDIEYNLRYRIITVSSSRTIENDISGNKMAELIGKNYERSIVKDDEVEILGELFCNYNKFDVFIYIGGTGASRLDQTSIALRKIADKEFSGFGELFRAKSGGYFPYISDASMFTYKKKIIFSIPGSENAQPVAYEIISRIVNHTYHELTKE